MSQSPQGGTGATLPRGSQVDLTLRKNGGGNNG